MATKPEIHKKITKVNFTDANRAKGQIKFLVRHYVGATGGAEANCNYFYNTYRGASAHYFIDQNGEIWQCVEENDIAWHCGASKYTHPECRNSNSIGVELCVKKNKKGNWYYTEATKKAAVELFAYLMDKYDVDEEHVLRHYDVTGKTCGEPDVRSDKIWRKFKDDIAGYGKGNGNKAENTKEASTSKSKKEESVFEPYQINTTCNSLFIRSEPSKNARKMGAINETEGHKKKYTIVKEENGWGKLKSGAGWISLAYTKKV